MSHLINYYIYLFGQNQAEALYSMHIENIQDNRSTHVVFTFYFIILPLRLFLLNFRKFKNHHFPILKYTSIVVAADIILLEIAKSIKVVNQVYARIGQLGSHFSGKQMLGPKIDASLRKNKVYFTQEEIYLRK